MWKAIRDMQRGRRGLIPSRVVTIHNEDNIPCTSTSAQNQHGGSISPRCSTSGANLMKKLGLVRQREVRDSLGNIPTSREVEKALGQLKNGKAAG